MAGASQSRLAKAGGNAQAAAQSLAQEYAAEVGSVERRDGKLFLLYSVPNGNGKSEGS